MKLTMPQQFENRMRDVAKALRRLKIGQGRGARKNARAAVKYALGNVRGVMEAHFPHVQVPKRVLAPGAAREAQKRGLTAARRSAIFRLKMKARNYVEVPDKDLVICIQEGGVRLQRPPARSDLSNEQFYAPLWALYAALDGRRTGIVNAEQTKVREARKSVTVRKALLAAHRLGAP